MESQLIIHKDRSIIEIKGADAKEFLQGLITNDIYKATRKNILYCAMLSPKGRFLYDFFIFEAENSLFLDVFALRADEIVKKLSFYKLKKDVIITKNNDLGVFYSTNSPENLDSGYIFSDPRSNSLGYRVYANEPELGGREVSADITNYEFTRIKSKVPESEKDLNYDKSIIVEYGLDDFNAIDYEKGCYVGQELTARTHHLGQVRKKIFYCRFHDQDLIAKNSEILLNNVKIGLALSSVKYNNIVYGLIFIKVGDDFDKSGANLTVDNIRIEILD